MIPIGSLLGLTITKAAIISIFRRASQFVVLSEMQSRTERVSSALALLQKDKRRSDLYKFASVDSWDPLVLLNSVRSRVRSPLLAQQCYVYNGILYVVPIQVPTFVSCK